MVNVLPRASPRAAAFGRKSNFVIAASTACLRPLLTLTVPLMIRDTVLAETPASRATILSVADWRGRGPLLPGLGAEGNFDFIALSIVCVIANAVFTHMRFARVHELRACFGCVRIPSSSSS